MPCPLLHALASSCLLRCVSPSPSHRLSDGPSFFPLFVSPVGSGHRLALPFPCHLIEYAVRLRLLACRCRGWGGDVFSSRHLVISSRRAVPPCVSCLLAARLACAVSSHYRRRLDRRFDRLLPVLRHGWAGRGTGSVGVLLAWFCPAVCADVCRCR